MSRARRIAVALAVAGAAFHAAPATAEPLTIAVGPTRIEFVGPTLGSPQTVTVTIQGGEPGVLTLAMQDAGIDPEGGWLKAPYGSTPNTLQGVLTLEPATFNYLPTADPQRFTASVSVDPTGVTQPLFGSLSAAVLPPAPEGGEGVSVTSVAAVEVQVLAAPSAEAIEAIPSSELDLRLDDLAIRQLQPWTPVDAAFPDLPGLVGHGPIEVSAIGRNAGTVVLDSRVTFSFTRVSPFALFGEATGTPTLTVENRPRFLLPGQGFVDSTTSLIPVEAASDVDSLPIIGFVRVTALVEGGLSGVEAEPAELTRTVLVFPWSEATFVFIVWLFQREWRHRKGRKVHAGEGPPPRTLRARIKDRISPPKAL